MTEPPAKQIFTLYSFQTQKLVPIGIQVVVPGKSLDSQHQNYWVGKWYAELILESDITELLRHYLIHCPFIPYSFGLLFLGFEQSDINMQAFAFLLILGLWFILIFSSSLFSLGPVVEWATVSIHCRIEPSQTQIFWGMLTSPTSCLLWWPPRFIPCPLSSFLVCCCH